MENLPSKAQEQPTMLQMILDRSSKIELIRTFNTLTVKKIIETAPPSLGMIEKEHGFEKMTACVGVLISDLNTSFEGSLSKDAIEEIIAEATTGLMKNHSLETLFLACKKLKEDDRIYKLTLNKVVKAIRKGFDEYQNTLIETNYNNHLAQKFTDPLENRDSEQERELHRQAQLMYNNNKLK